MKARQVQEKALLNAQHREELAEARRLIVVRYETNLEALAQGRYPRRKDLPTNAMFPLPCRARNTKGAWVNIEVPHHFEGAYRGLTQGAIPSVFLDDYGDLHPDIRLHTGSSGKPGEVTYEDMVEHRRVRNNIRIPALFKPLDTEEVPMTQMFTRAAAAGIGAGAGVAASDVASNPTPLLEATIDPTVFRFPSDLTPEDKLLAVAGTLNELHEAVFQRHLAKNSPAERAREEKKKAKEEKKAKRQIVSCVFVCYYTSFIQSPDTGSSKIGRPTRSATG
jgi:hypothetical protein